MGWDLGLPPSAMILNRCIHHSRPWASPYRMGICRLGSKGTCRLGSKGIVGLVAKWGSKQDLELTVLPRQQGRDS